MFGVPGHAGRVLRKLRRGIVLGLPGGIDSSVSAALAVAAVGAKRVLGVMMPERDSDPDSLRLGHSRPQLPRHRDHREHRGEYFAAAGCYRRRDEFIRRLVPEFSANWGCKVVLTHSGAYNITQLVVQSPAGERQTVRMPLDVYLGVVAATNMKQRTRKQLEYYHADRLNYAVLGTPNRLEYDQGFSSRTATARPTSDQSHLSGRSTRSRSISGCRNPLAPADHRHLVARAEPGRIYFSVPYR